MKQGNVAAPSRVVDDPEIKNYFQHHGHRTVVSQRALQAHADPWLGWTEIGGVGQVVLDADRDARRQISGLLQQAAGRLHGLGLAERRVGISDDGVLHAAPKLDA